MSLERARQGYCQQTQETLDIWETRSHQFPTKPIEPEHVPDELFANDQHPVGFGAIASHLSKKEGFATLIGKRQLITIVLVLANVGVPQ